MRVSNATVFFPAGLPAEIIARASSIKISLYGGLDTEEKLPWCTLPNMGLMEPEKLAQSCLRIKHINPPAHTGKVPKSVITNVCEKGGKKTHYMLQCTATKSKCGYRPLARSLSPDNRKNEEVGYANCCVTKEWQE